MEDVMKKFTGIALCVLLSVSVLLVSFGNVSALPLDTTQVNPVFTPISGDKSYTTEFLPIVDLPGIATLASGMLVPAGFPNGEKQFEGLGLKLTGFDGGSASACFAINTVNQGWGGQVGKWNGSKWELLPTSISTPSESPYSWACTTVNASGTYALITWVTDASKLVSTYKPDCGFDLLDVYEASTTVGHNGTDYQDGTFQRFFIRTTDAVDFSGLPLTVSVSSDPVGTYTWDRTMSGTLQFNGGSGSNYYYYIVISPDGYYYNEFPNNISRTYHMDFGTCTQDLTYNGAG
jgi:hypothetical protein